CDTSSVKEISLKDRVITELNSRVFKLESIIKVLGHERNGVFVDKLDSGEYFSNLSSEFWEELNHESIELLESPCCGTRLAMVDGDSDDDVVKLKEEVRLREEKEKLLKYEEEKKKRRYELTNSDHWKASRPSNVLNDQDMNQFLKDVRPWVEDLSRPNRAPDRVCLSDAFDIFLGRPRPLRCRFPWCKDVSVD
ncbi:hypothetical protein Tco_1176800, partial [Tanacetum coccineum]